MSRDSKKIATLWDNKNTDDSEDHDCHNPDERQAFYAGGSQHSGQQILGPSRDSNESNRLIENLFQHARQSAAVVSDPSSSSTGPPVSSSSFPITFWRNGFTVGDEGELRDYNLPENRQFLECLKRGDTPPELASRVRGGMIDVRLDNKALEDYKPERKLQAFSGEGHRLGAPAPETADQPQVSSEGQQAPASASSGLAVDESKPTTTVQVRLVDNTRLVIRANLDHRVGDLVSHIRAIRPQYSSSNFVLASNFPAKELTDLEQTVEEAKLANASVLQKIKR